MMEWMLSTDIDMTFICTLWCFLMTKVVKRVFNEDGNQTSVSSNNTSHTKDIQITHVSSSYGTTIICMASPWHCRLKSVQIRSKWKKAQATDDLEEEEWRNIVGAQKEGKRASTDGGNFTDARMLYS